MQVLKTRGDVIRWAGAVRAYPVIRGRRPDFSRPGDAETGASRVGWKEFFAAFNRYALVLVVETPDGFEHRLLEKKKAVAELPREAFGPPLMQRVWHEIMLEKPVEKS